VLGSSVVNHSLGANSHFKFGHLILLTAIFLLGPQGGAKVDWGRGNLVNIQDDCDRKICLYQERKGRICMPTLRRNEEPPEHDVLSYEETCRRLYTHLYFMPKRVYSEEWPCSTYASGTS
jgi:hypothetical protein